MSKYITRPGIYVMLFSEELQMLKRYQLIHPHCLTGSSGSFSLVALGGNGGNRKVMSHPHHRMCCSCFSPENLSSVLWPRLSLHSSCTEGKLRLGGGEGGAGQLAPWRGEKRNTGGHASEHLMHRTDVPLLA